jgi:hypothetical protein
MSAFYATGRNPQAGAASGRGTVWPRKRVCKGKTTKPHLGLSGYRQRIGHNGVTRTLVFQGEAAQVAVNVRLARPAEVDQQPQDRCAMHESDSGRRSERVALYQVVEDFDLPLSRKVVRHCEIPFCWGPRLELSCNGHILVKAGL